MGQCKLQIYLQLSLVFRCKILMFLKFLHYFRENSVSKFKTISKCRTNKSRVFYVIIVSKVGVSFLMCRTFSIPSSRKELLSLSIKATLVVQRLKVGWVCWRAHWHGKRQIPKALRDKQVSIYVFYHIKFLYVFLLFTYRCPKFPVIHVYRVI